MLKKKKLKLLLVFLHFTYTAPQLCSFCQNVAPMSYFEWLYKENMAPFTSGFLKKKYSHKNWTPFSYWVQFFIKKPYTFVTISKHKYEITFRPTLSVLGLPESQHFLSTVLYKWHLSYFMVSIYSCFTNKRLLAVLLILPMNLFILNFLKRYSGAPSLPRHLFKDDRHKKFLSKKSFWILWL